jgi:uncharacterized protein with HEPN domain
MHSKQQKTFTALEDLLYNIDYALSKTANIDYAFFSHDRDRLYIVVRCLEIISEATRRVSEDIKARHSQIPWRRIADAGNVYRHEYDSLDSKLVWDTVTVALPPLRQVVTTELHRLAGE